MTRPLEREDIYAKIDQERDYQDSVWGVDQDARKSLADWAVFIHVQSEELMKDVYGSSQDHLMMALHRMRKIAALAVACMEYNGCPPRRDA